MDLRSVAHDRRVRDECRQVYRAQTPVLRAAGTSLEGWRIHVVAMNRLVAGQITLPQAVAFWNRTRLQAGDLLNRYDDAARAFARRALACPASPQTADRSGGSSGGAGADARAVSTACKQAINDRDVVLRRARIALSTWRMHVHHMEMLREGMMSPQEALRLWQLNWHAGVRQLRSYDAARHHAADASC